MFFLHKDVNTDLHFKSKGLKHTAQATDTETTDHQGAVSIALGRRSCFQKVVSLVSRSDWMHCETALVHPSKFCFYLLKF